MPEQTFGDISFRQIVVALAILIVFCGLAWLLRLVLVKFIKKLAQKTVTNLDDTILSTLRKPLIIIVILLGLYIAVLTLPQEVNVWSNTLKGLATALSLMGIFTGVAFLETVIRWYRRKVVAEKIDVGFSIRLIGFI